MNFAPFTRMPFGIQSVIILIAGAVMALAMPPTDIWPLLFVGLSAFYVVLAQHRGRKAFIIGWLFGFGYFTAGLYWIGNALLIDGNTYKWAWPFAVIGLPIGLAIFTGLAAYIATRFANLKTWSGYGLCVAMLLISEWLRGHILTGFPWNLYGYGWAGVLPMVQSVSAIGIYGLTAITAIWATLPGFLCVSRPAVKTFVASILLISLSICGLYSWGQWRLQSNPGSNDDTVMVRVVQPSIAQSEKWSGDKMAENFYQTIDTGARPFMPGKTYAVVMPETAITDDIVDNMNARTYIRNGLFATEDNRFLITGILRRETNTLGQRIHFNSLGTYDQDMVPMAMYDKAHLVPFGEYIPFNNIIPLHPLVKFSGFTSGPGPLTQTVLGLPPFGALICYEVIFSNAAVAKNTDARWIVNVTNDGWYGDSPGPYQHLAMAVFRSVEQGLPLARAANTGISAIIDPYGRILARLPYNSVGSIDHPLPNPTPSKTFFSKTGNLFFFLLVLLLVIPILRRFYNLRDR